MRVDSRATIARPSDWACRTSGEMSIGSVEREGRARERKLDEVEDVKVLRPDGRPRDFGVARSSVSIVWSGERVVGAKERERDDNRREKDRPATNFG